jgi:hypothetical protein
MRFALNNARRRRSVNPFRFLCLLTLLLGALKVRQSANQSYSMEPKLAGRDGREAAKRSDLPGGLDFQDF